MSNKYNWKFILDGTTDITDKVTSFTIDSSLESYCRELSLDLADYDLFDTFNFAIIPEEPRIEVFTSIESTGEDEYEESIWISQGVFFIEKPTYTVNSNYTTTGIWGRQSTAILGEPFSQKITKIWSSDTTFYDICQEILESVGLIWSDSNCDLDDFIIYADTFESMDLYPIETMQKLVELLVGAEGFVTSNRLGEVVIKRLVRSSEIYDFTFVDNVIQSINEEPEWPEFGNRIKIIPGDSISQDSIEMYMDTQCIGDDSSTYINVYAQVKDGSNVPINNKVVDWLFSPEEPISVNFKYPILGKTSTQNTERMLISKELVKTSGFLKVETKFEIAEVIGIWAYADKDRIKNFAPTDGYTIDGKTINLTEEVFTYCDQTVFVSYYADGMVKNTIEYLPVEGEIGDTLFGELVVISSVSGKDASQILYVNNSCQCVPSLRVETSPTSCTLGENVKITAYVEIGGIPVVGTVRMQELSGFGTLQQTVMQTGEITITEEVSEVVNNINGVSQCVLATNATTVIDVYVKDSNGDPIGSNLYSSFIGNTIDLTTYIVTGTDLLVTYTRSGSVTNYMATNSIGNAIIVTSVDVDIEAGLSSTTQVTISDPSSSSDVDSGDNQEYIVTGPSVVTISYFSDIIHDSRTHKFDTMAGPYRLAPKVPATTIEELTLFAQTLGVQTISITVPHISIMGNSMINISNWYLGKSFTITVQDNKGHSASMVVNCI